MLATKVVFLSRLRGTDQRAPWPFLAQAYKGESDVSVPLSSTNTNRWASIPPATITLKAHLKNSSRSIAPIVLFSTEVHPLQESPDGGLAEGLARDAPHEEASFGVGGRRTILRVRVQEPLRVLVGLRRSSAFLSWYEGLSPVNGPGVALKRGDTDANEAGSLRLGHPKGTQPAVSQRRLAL